MSRTSRLVPVPERARSAHGVFTVTPISGATDFPPPADVLLRRFGASDDALARLGRTRHTRMFLTEVPPAEAAEAALAARRAAVELAAEHDGVVIDLTLPRLVEGPVGTAAAQWVAVDIDGGGLTTRGLEAFGLPEARLDDVSPEGTAPSIAVLLGLAHRLIAEWPEHDPVGPAAVTLRDVALAYGDETDLDASDATGGRSTDLMIDFHDHELVLTLVGDPAADLFA